jgi:outer membrane protein assembly factor BamB
MIRNMRIASLFLLVATVAAAQPSITKLSNTTISHSSRLLIHGSGFRTEQGIGRVEIGGIAAPFTRWTDTLIVAYVPDAAPIGVTNVQIFAPEGTSSNRLPLKVTFRPAPTSRVRWRFKADADYIYSRPAVAKNGTVYTIDSHGHLYALSSTGGLKWIFNATGTGFGNVSVGPDGTIYTGSTSSIFALRPNGTLRWKFDQNPGAFILLGPNVGPDGNIYAVGTQGMGVFSLTPQGTLRWAIPENYDRPIVILQEIVFAPASQSRLYFHANDHLRGIGLDGTPLFNYVDGLPQDDHQLAVAPDGSLYSNLFSARGPGLMMGKFDDDGNLLWHIFDQFSNSTNALSAPDVGSDGVIYDGRNLSELYAIKPDGTVKWQYTDSLYLLSPIVSPLNDLIFVGGFVNGQPGFLEAVSTKGRLLWKVGLPSENGLNVTPLSRGRFAPNGETAYIGTSIPGQGNNPYCYLYSVRIGK